MPMILRVLPGDPATAPSSFVFARARRLAAIIVQLGLLLALNHLGAALVEALAIPLPGTVAGMMLLFAALALGLVPLSWVEEAATLLIRHLAFFFIPIAVGLMTFGELIARDGLALLAALAVSAAVGIGVTGWMVQTISRAEVMEKP